MTTRLESYTIRKRPGWGDAITVEIERDPAAPPQVKLGLAVRTAFRRGADLRGADLRGVDLHGADLYEADLYEADLHGADLHGADLRGADLHGAALRSFKADLWMTLLQAQPEVPALVRALREGRVDGSTYDGECACLVGALANAHAGNGGFLADRSASNPAEQWFLMIRTGDRPGEDSAGGYAAQMALEWTLEFCRLAGIAIDTEAEAQTASAVGVQS